MRERWVVGNWKMYGNKHSVKNLLTTLKSAYNLFSSPKMVVCPSYVFLAEVQAQLQESVIGWGAQNMAAEKEGAYTGEISASMLGEFGCRYVLLGHSERRILFAETEEQIAKKFMLAVQQGLIPILCVGESREQRRANETESILKHQLKLILDFLKQSIMHPRPWILAYEPVWAIGTDSSASPEQAQEVHQFLRKHIEGRFPDLAQKLSILYGGSVKPANARSLFRMPDIDGGLVGGASLEAHPFLEIYTECR